jgi:hypothetical protein
MMMMVEVEVRVIGPVHSMHPNGRLQLVLASYLP